MRPEGTRLRARDADRNSAFEAAYRRPAAPAIVTAEPPTPWLNQHNRSAVVDCAGWATETVGEPAQKRTAAAAVAPLLRCSAPGASSPESVNALFRPICVGLSGKTI